MLQESTDKEDKANQEGKEDQGGHEDKESLVTFICVPFFCYGSSMHKLCTSAGEIFFWPGLGKQFYYIISPPAFIVFDSVS